MNNTNPDSEEARNTQTVKDACQLSNAALVPDKDNASDSGQGGSLTARAGSAAPARPSAHRAAPAQLEGGHAVRVANVVTAIYGNESAYTRSALIEAMTLEIKPLMDVSTSEASARIASYAPVLEAMFLVNARNAAEAKNPEHAAHFSRMSLQAHDRLQRLYALLAGVQQSRPREVAPETADGASDS